MKLFKVPIDMQAIFTPLACLLFAIGSTILLLAWIFFDFFASMITLDIYSWLPLIILLTMLALLIGKKWVTIILNLSLVIISLVGVYYLLIGIGSLVGLPNSFITSAGFIMLLILNGVINGLTYRVQKARRSTKKNVQPQRRTMLKRLTQAAFSLALGGIFVKAYIWDDPTKKWLVTDLFHQEIHKLTLASPMEALLTDASHLNVSRVAEIRAPKTVADVLKAVKDAKESHKKISMSGIRHSMGGQALGQDTLHLDMTAMDAIHYNPIDQSITAGPGATWEQIQAVLSPYGRAVKIMQDSNIFSIGGSLSVNVHGKDPAYGSFIESVNFLKVVTADGKEMLCNRTANRDLFAAVIGGLGLLGIITEVNLQTTEDTILSFSLQPMQTHLLINALETLSKDPKNRLLEAHLSVDKDHFLDESLIYRYAEVSVDQKPSDEIDGENNIWLRKIVFQASRASNFGKYFRWEMEKYITPLVEAKTESRNTAMAVPVRFLQNPDPESTDLLQEYFVPIEQADTFLINYAKLIKKHNINLLNVTIRRVMKDTNALVSYAQKDMYGFVVYYKVEKNARDIQVLEAFTGELIDYLITIQGTYYLCYGGYYSSTQLTIMYPTIRKLVALKVQRDPQMLFTNVWFEKYRKNLSQTLLV